MVSPEPKASYEQEDERPGQALRLTFRYSGDEIALVEAERVQMLAPPSDRLGKLEDCSGFCCEVRSRRGRVLYRRFGADPIQRSIEVRTGSPEQPFVRQDIPEPSGEFDIVVPYIEDYATIALLSDGQRIEPGPMETVAVLTLEEILAKTEKY